MEEFIIESWCKRFEESVNIFWCDSMWGGYIVIWYSEFNSVVNSIRSVLF